MKLQLENPGSSRDLGSLPAATMGDDDSSESVVPTTRGVAPPPARQEDLNVLRTGLVGNRATSGRPIREELLAVAGRLRRVVRTIGTQMEAAKVARVSVQQVRRYVSGRDTPPTSVVTSLAEATGFNISWILTGRGPEITALEGQLSTPQRHRAEPERLEYSAYIQRFRWAVKRLGSLDDAAYILDVPKTQLHHPTGGSRDKTRSIFMVAALARAAGVNFHWLATGEGPRTGAPVPATTPTPARGTVQDEPEALEIGRAVLTLLRALKKA